MSEPTANDVAVLVIDDREGALIAALRAQKVPFIVEHLALADVLIRCGTTTVVALERKTCNDLAGSIVDGRWREQKQRLKVMRATCRASVNPLSQGAVIGYIIEGNFFDVNRTHSLPPTTLVSAATMASARDGFTVVQTMGVTETAQTLSSMLRHAPFVGYSELREQSLVSDPLQGAEPPMLSRQEKMRSPNVILFRMLRCVPGVSPPVGKLVVNKYRTCARFRAALKNDAERQKIEQTLRPPGKKQKIGIKTVLAMKAAFGVGTSE